MRPRKLLGHFDRITNVATVLAAIFLAALFARSYFSEPPPHSDPEPFKQGTVLQSFDGVDLHKSVRTLLLALSTNCRYCSKSLPFYKELLRAIPNGASDTVQLIALFPESREEVDSYLKLHELPLNAVPGVNYGVLKVPFTPSVILVDSNGEVLNSWGGVLTEDEQKDVHKALLERPTSAEDPDRFRAVEFNQTASLFDENKPVAVIRPSDDVLGDVQTDNRLLRATRRQINYFAVNSTGDIYLAVWPKILKYTGDGKLLWSVDAPEGFAGPLAVDEGGQLYLTSKAGIALYSKSAGSRLIVPAEKLPYSDQAYTIKTVYDPSVKRLYLQTYDPLNVSQTLFALDSTTKEIKKVHTQKHQVKFTPTYAPGAFDFALGEDRIFVSDIYDYRIYMYSLTTGRFLGEFHRSVGSEPIRNSDGVLINRKMTVGNLTGPGLLKNYPPILHLAVTNKGYLAVWTSHRDPGLRQKIDLYDSQMKFVGSDLKYAHPVISNYVFANNKVYVPDLGFGRAFPTRGISPLDVPSKALSLKVFEDWFQRSFGPTANS